MTKENHGTERKTPSPALGINMWISAIQNLKLIRRWFLERFTNIYSAQLSRKNSTIAIYNYNILHFFCFEAVARVLDDVSNKRLKFADRSLELYFRLITTTQKITLLVKFTCPGQRPIIPSLSSYTPLVLRIPWSWGSVFYTVWREEATIGSVTADLAD